MQTLKNLQEKAREYEEHSETGLQSGTQTYCVFTTENLNCLITHVWNEAIKECEGCVPKAISDCESCNDCEAMMICPRREAHNSCRNQTLQAIRQMAYNRDTNTR